MNAIEKAFFTDNELMDRWHVTEMTLWRWRKYGKLSKPTKIGIRNLTPADEVKRFEEEAANASAV
jgi:hypothetical protein